MIKLLKYSFILLFIFAENIKVKAQFIIEPGSSVSITNSGELYINTNLTLYSNSSGSGYLADQTSGGSLIVTSNILIERYISSSGWHNVGSPVSSSGSSLFSETDMIFYYDETKVQNDWNFGWVWYPSGSFTNFKAYDIYFDAGGQTINYTTSNSSGLNSGSFSISITNTDVPNGETENHKGWNLIANPYPSPVDWLTESGWDKSDINDAKYIWNPQASNYTIFLGGSDPVGINGGTRYIPSNQGFWVQATTNGTFSINNACRRGIMSSTPDYYKNQEVEYPLISLIASVDTLSDETVIRCLRNTTNDYDLNSDAVKLFSQGDYVPQIYTEYNKTNYAINTVPDLKENMIFPLNFKCKSSASCSLRLSSLSYLNDIENIYLYDNLTEEMINIKQKQVYYFNHQINNDASRFLLIVNPTQDKLKEISNKSYYDIYSVGNRVFINQLTTVTEEGQVLISNIMGQRIDKFNLNTNKFSFTIESSPGIYIVNIITPKGNDSRKLYIK